MFAACLTHICARIHTSKCLTTYSSTSSPFSHLSWYTRSSSAFFWIIIIYLFVCLFSHIWSLCSLLRSWAFSLGTDFSSVTDFLFELNQISLQPERDIAYVRDGVASQNSCDVCVSWRRAPVHTSNLQLSITDIKVTAMTSSWFSLKQNLC